MHVIRLRRPWEKARPDGSQASRIDVPEANDASADPQAAYRYCRRFNTPSGLSASNRLYLRIDGWRGRLESATINDHPLVVASSRINADITALVQTHNQITLVLAGHSGQSASLNGEVTLAIEDNPQ